MLSKKLIDRFLSEINSGSAAVYWGFHLPGARYEFEREDGKYMRPLVKDHLSADGIFAWKLVGNSWMADSFYGEGFDSYWFVFYKKINAIGPSFNSQVTC